MNRERRQLLQEFLDEHQRLTTRLGQLDAAITLIRGDEVIVPSRPEPKGGKRKAKKRPKKERRKFVRRALPLRAVEPVRAEPRDEPPTAARDRRDLVLKHIRKAADAGLTLGGLKALTPHMSVSDRGNALQGLKKDGKIRRVGTSWIAQAPFDQ